jgi:hypothetical protein
VRPYLEKAPHKKRASGMTESVGPKFKPQYRKRKKERNLNANLH